MLTNFTTRLSAESHGFQGSWRSKGSPKSQTPQTDLWLQAFQPQNEPLQEVQEVQQLSGLSH